MIKPGSTANSVYLSFFAKPASLLFPKYKYIFYLAPTKYIYVVMNKDITGRILYDGYGYIEDIVKIDNGVFPSYHVRIRFDSKKVETFVFDSTKSVYNEADRWNDYPNFYRYKNALFLPGVLKKGDFVRVSFYSNLPLAEYVVNKKGTEQKELIETLTKMPYWLSNN